MSIERLITDFWNYAITKRRGIIDYLKSGESQIEGWFKAEFLYFLTQRGITPHREYKISDQSRKKVDVEFKIEEIQFLVEMKHLIYRQRRSSTYTIQSYFLKSSSGSIYPDIEKLRSADDSSMKYALAFYSGYRNLNENSLADSIKCGITRAKVSDPEMISIANCNHESALDSGFFLLQVQ